MVKISSAVWVMIVILLLIELVGMFFAVYLSWTSNSLIGNPAVLKVIFAIFAFLSGINYLFIHLVNKWDMVRYIKSIKSNGWRQPPQMQMMQPQMQPASNSNNARRNSA